MPDPNIRTKRSNLRSGRYEWLKEESIPLPFLMSGGIGPKDAIVVRQIGHEAFLGVDVNSRFELFPGMKDVNLLDEFIREIRKEM